MTTLPRTISPAATRRLAAAMLTATVGVAGLLSGCADEADPDPVPASETVLPNESEVYLIECVPENTVEQPASFVLSCADSGEWLDGLTWTSWGEPVATATGALVRNNCEPSCAEGTDERFEVTVTADRLVEGDSIAAYARLRVQLTETGKTETYRLPVPQQES